MRLILRRLAEEWKRSFAGAEAVLADRLPWFPQRMPNRCLWPTSHRTSCGKMPELGQLCSEHLDRVRSQGATWDCLWPGCTRRTWDKKSFCSFHHKIAFGLLDPYGG